VSPGSTPVRAPVSKAAFSANRAYRADHSRRDIQVPSCTTTIVAVSERLCQLVVFSRRRPLTRGPKACHLWANRSSPAPGSKWKTPGQRPLTTVTVPSDFPTSSATARLDGPFRPWPSSPATGGAAVITAMKQTLEYLLTGAL
jgi:hypothetical protein